MTRSSHAAVRAQQRYIAPLIKQWLDQFGEEKYDGNGAYYGISLQICVILAWA